MIGGFFFALRRAFLRCRVAALLLACVLSSPYAPLKAQTTEVLLNPQTENTSLSPSELSLLQKKANVGDAPSQAQLGEAYLHGRGVPQNFNLALQWLRKSAEQGDPTAEYDLGIMYRLGNGVERSKEEAVRWFRKAAKQGNAKAMFNLGVAYYNGDGVGIDDVASYAWFLLSQEAGDPAANDAVSRAASEKTTPADAYVRLAEMYAAGEDMPRDPEKSIKWYRKASDAGNPDAAMKVAVFLLAPGRKPTPEEYAEARQRCEDASKHSASGAYCMVIIYRRGVGVAKDPAETAKWLNRAAEMGSGRAALELAEAYWKGDGVKADRVEAYKWIWLALNSKVSGAEQDEQAFRAEMNAKQVAQAKNKSIEWSRTHHFVGLMSRRDETAPEPK